MQVNAPSLPDPLIVSLVMSTLNRCFNSMSNFCFFITQYLPRALYTTGTASFDIHVIRLSVPSVLVMTPGCTRLLEVVMSFGLRNIYSLSNTVFVHPLQVATGVIPISIHLNQQSSCLQIPP